MMDEAAAKGSDESVDKRPQFGNRLLTDPRNVFQHNAWDNVVWDTEQEEVARKKTQEQAAVLVPENDQDALETKAGDHWNDFYTQHQNRFFKDRHWLFTEFPELAPEGASNDSTNGCVASACGVSNDDSDKCESVAVEGSKNMCDTDRCVTDRCVTNRCDTDRCDAAGSDTDKCDTARSVGDGQVFAKGDSANCNSSVSSSTITGGVGDGGGGNDGSTIGSGEVHTNSEEVPGLEETYPGEHSTVRILEVGCGVGNTVFPILQTNNDPGLMVYCCDFSSTAIQLVKEHPDHDPRRCHAFVCDVSDPEAPVPMPTGSLDIIILIFVLSAIHPDKMQGVITRLASCLKPGGIILFRDYGRYDMAQLRFKKGRCLAENFYVRGDSTRVYFFTQEELKVMFESAGLEEQQNVVDRRLQVNRGKQLKMYRVWIQCKYRKPLP